MSTHTSIAWANSTWNPIRATNGKWTCAKISPGCTHCYAERLNIRFRGQPYRHDTPYLDRQILHDPFRWRRPQHIFPCSTTDLFWNRISIEWTAEIFNVMASATLECHRRHHHEEACWTGPSHTFTILTKRAQRMHQILTVDLPEHVGEHWPGDTPLSIALSVKWPLPNVQLGISCENQHYFDERWPWLARTSTPTRVLCLEPLLGPIDLRLALGRACARHHTLVREPDWPQHPRCYDCGHPWDLRPVNWVIVGGESGPHARHMELTWLRSIVEQCRATHTPIFVKQDCGVRPGQQGRIPDSLWIHQWPIR